MDIRLGKTVAVCVDENTYLAPSGSERVKSRIVAIQTNDVHRYVVAWRDGDDTPVERKTAFPGNPSDFRRVSNFDEYDYYYPSWAMNFRAEDLKSKKGTKTMAKILGDVKEDAVDAAWRQGVEKVIESGHKHLVARATATLGSARGKLVASFLESNVGRHVLAYGLGVALETAVPHVDDERLERLAKELRVYGLEVVMGFFVTEVQGFLKDALKHLPKKVPSLPAT